MDMHLAGLIFQRGTVRAEHSGKTQEREYCDQISGRPWIMPQEKVVEYDGRIYLVRMPEEGLHPRYDD